MSRKYIILGLTPQGLALLREMGKARADVTAFCASKNNVGYASRYGSKYVFHTIDDLKVRIGSIVAHTDSKPICYITSGELLAEVLKNFKEIYDLCEVYSGPYEVVERLAHKDLMYEIAIRHGMKVAKYATLDKYSDGELHFPLFLKRNYEVPLFFKAVKIADKATLDGYISRIPAEHIPNVIAQEFIDIKKENLLNLSCQGFFVGGECCGIYLANQKRRLSKGITSYIEEVKDASIKSRVENIVKSFMAELKYSGFAEFEFMLDTVSDELYFIEVNTRTCGLQSGMHHKFGNLSQAVLNPSERIRLEPKIDRLNWMNIIRDIRARVQSRDFTHLTDIFHSKFDIFSLSDLKPFIHQIIRL